METIGLLPCAGLGLRMRPLRYPKELLPVSFESSWPGGPVRPKLSLEYALEAFRLARIRKCFAIVPEWKPEIMRYLGDGLEFKLDMAYLYNSKAAGLAEAILSASPWMRNKITCLALPDTRFEPSTAFIPLLSCLTEKKADLLLGIFPTEEASHFAPVEIDHLGRITGIEEKPQLPKAPNTWGIAAWTDKFVDFFIKKFESSSQGLSITNFFHDAVVSGLRVEGVCFGSGKYVDIGRIDAFPFTPAVKF
ncbi:MAG TPA: sugar phosphate nucleotidyltransferase [Puia sp.]|nr:sugar phosphate nucleotidyltransferase [Puia sp.]